MQKKPKQINIVVVGCGGIGGCLLNTLPIFLSYQSGANCRIHLIDGDDFEEQNRERQTFSRLGNKAEVKAEEIKNSFPNLYIGTTSDYITEANIPLLIKEDDIVFSCVDNHATRKLISDHCEENLKNITVISGGNDYTDGNVQVFCKKDGENLTVPVASSYHPEIQNPTDENPGDRLGCADLLPSEPQLIICNNLVASHMLCALYGLLNGVFEDKRKYDEVYLDVPTNKASPRVRK